MITIEIRNAEKIDAGIAAVEIFCDLEGLTLLSKQIEHLKSGSTHIHMMTPTWAGNELGENLFGNGTTLIHHLQITMLPASTPGSHAEVKS